MEKALRIVCATISNRSRNSLWIFRQRLRKLLTIHLDQLRALLWSLKIFDATLFPPNLISTHLSI